MPKKILLIGVNEKAYTTKNILQALETKKDPFDFIKWGSLEFENGKVKSAGKELVLKKYRSAFIDVPNFDLILNREKNVKLKFQLSNELQVILRKLEIASVFAINGSFMREYAFYNKFTQAQIYAEKNIPTIPTLHITDNKFEKVLALLASSGLTLPLVAKLSHGGEGEQVWKIKNKKELELFLLEKRNANLIYQPYLKNTGDYRILVVGGKSLGIMKRTAQKGEWRNNFALGGSVKKYTDKKMERFAEKACRKMGLDYAGVDVFKINGQYSIIEINIFACFAGFEKTYAKTSVAEKIINCLKR